MRRARAAIWIVLCCVLAAYARGDDTEYTYGSTSDADGPPYAALDLSEADEVVFADEGLAPVTLPFAFSWYGTEVESAWISEDGALFFEDPGDTPAASCPGAGSGWSGAAAWWADLGAGEVRAQVFGRYPRRALAVQWTAPGAGGGAEGQSQLWLMEGRDEVVITQVEPAYEGAAALGISGVSGGDETGIAWTCTGGLAAESSAWFGLPSSRPDSAARAASALVTLTGDDEFAYAGRSLAAGDLEPDGWADLIVGNQDDDRVYVHLGGPGLAGGALSEADAVLSGSSGDDLGAAIALGDMDGDGASELGLGAPGSDVAGSAAGGAWVLSAAALPSTASLPSDADLRLYGPSGTGKAAAGTALAMGDLDGDGYEDLAVGAPRADDAGTDAGSVYLWPGAASALSGYASLSDATTRLEGELPRDQAGRALAMGGADEAGVRPILVGAPYADAVESDGTVSNAGRAYLVWPELGVGGVSLEDAALVVQGSGDDARLGSALAWGDVDGDGAGDLILGAPFADTGASSAGAAYALFGAEALSGTVSADDADLSVAGTETGAALGTAVVAMDLSGDGVDDLIIAAPNAAGLTSDGGVVAIYTGVAAGSATLDDADHQVLGDDGSSAAGTAMAASADHDGDGGPDLFVGAPGASPGGLTLAGAVYAWSFAGAFTDGDGDGFVAANVGGIDCDDGDPESWPGAHEVLASGVDEDCDGWIDGVVIRRDVAEHHEWDLAEEIGETSPVTYDFEDTTAGEDVDELYLDDGLYMVADGDLTATGSVWGSLPSGELGARVLAGSSGDNGLNLVFETPIDALSLFVLDGDGPFTVQAWRDDVEVSVEIPFEVSGDDRTAGVYEAFTFAVSVDAVRIAAISEDAWGVDDISVVWARDTDRDEDGYTDNGGDCDDEDAAVSPAAAEVLEDGVDNDCDGVIDGGELDLYDDWEGWLVALDEEPEIIDFEDAREGLSIDVEYEDRGVLFEPALTVSTNLDGSAPVDTLGGEVDGATLRLSFDELQPGVAIQLLDARGPLVFDGYAYGDLLYSFTWEPDGEDLDGGTFLGLMFDYGVTDVELRADSDVEVWGIDDLAFAPLGRDDSDGDGFTEAEGDCDDHDAEASPEGTETWYDGVDGDCDGGSDYDSDRDGADDAVFGGTDCDDGSSTAHPGAEDEPYDGVDADCDGWSDYDADRDGHDDEAYGGDDCDDGDGEVSPDAAEVYYDGVDADCSGTSDYDADGDGYVGSEYGGSVSGDPSVEVGDCDDGVVTSFPGAEDEAYDGVDSDCAGDSDFDADDDGFDAEEFGGTDCDDGDATAWPGSTYERCYDDKDSDCAGDTDWDCDLDGEEKTGHGGSDCDDADPEIHTGAEDLPRDGVDSDCDGALEFDDDGDGYDGEEDGGDDCDDDDDTRHPDADETCYDGVDQDCDGWSDDDCDLDSYDALDAGGSDCDDTDASVHPGAIDYYYDGIDNDCDGDEDFDADGDGWPADWYGGSDCDDTDPSIYPHAPDAPYDGVDSDCGADGDYDADDDGSASDVYGGTDCDDADAEVNPSAAEIPLDGTDQDCDGIDDVDEDEDGAWSADDCDDADDALFPGAPETCYDGVDQDCDGADLVDCDGDGFDAPEAGGEDCDDGDAATYPGADDAWYDGVDADCAGDDDLDQDGDGYTIDTLGGTDCDDTDAEVSPAVTVDACGRGDEDCDGAADEDCETGSDTGSDTGGDSGGQHTGGDDSGDSGGDSTINDSESDIPEDDTSGPGTESAQPEIVPQGGCGCGTVGGGQAAAALLVGMLGALGRRRSRGV